MQKVKAIIILIICLFFSAREVFALAAPIERVEWSADFQSSGAIDDSRSTTQWQYGFVSLSKQDDNYISSGVLWTGDISFYQDIRSLTLGGDYDQPGGTSILAFVNFDGDIREYSLNWGAVYYPENRVRKLRLKIFLATNNTALSPKLYKLHLEAELQDRSESGASDRDNGRVSDLKRVSEALKKYHDDFGQYPVVNCDKNDKTSQWRILKDILDYSSTYYRKDYNYGFVAQATGVDNEYQYGYLTDNLGVYYLLWTRLEENGSKHFKDSWKGMLFDVNCSEPTYCFSLKIANTVPESILRHFEESQNETKPTINKITNATFVREENNPRVWLRLDNHRLWLRTPEIFEKVGGVWEDVVLRPILAEIPLFKFIKKEKEAAVYLVTPSGFKRPMPDIKALNFYGQLSETVTVDDHLIDVLPDNELIRAKGDVKVYWLDQKIKRWITSPATLERLGFDFSQVVEVDPRELDYYPEGTPIF